jgi:predicted transcriptional regulator
MTTAEEIMDEPDFIDHDASIEDVSRELDSQENTLIVKRDGEAVGEIHEHSLLKELIPEERIDEEKIIGILGFSFDRKYVAEIAEDAMNEHEASVSPDDDVGEIAFLMDREDLRAIPVKEDGEVVGVVHENSMIEELF